jgi:hypothetical protein
VRELERTPDMPRAARCHQVPGVDGSDGRGARPLRRRAVAWTRAASPLRPAGGPRLSDRGRRHDERPRSRRVGLRTRPPVRRPPCDERGGGRHHERFDGAVARSRPSWAGPTTRSVISAPDSPPTRRRGGGRTTQRHAAASASSWSSSGRPTTARRSRPVGSQPRPRSSPRALGWRSAAAPVRETAICCGQGEPCIAGRSPRAVRTSCRFVSPCSSRPRRV